MVDQQARRYLDKHLGDFRARLAEEHYVSRRLYPEGPDAQHVWMAEKHGYLRTDEAPPIVDADLGRQGRIVVLGNAGAGKSLIMRRAFVALAEQWLSVGEGLDPLWLDLGWLGTGGDILKTIRSRSNGLWDALSTEGLGGVVLLMDGLDEAVMQRGQGFVNDLWQFLSDECGDLAGVCLTCRRAVWDPAAVAGLGPAFAVYSADYLEPECYDQVIPSREQREAFFHECRELGLGDLLQNPFDGFSLARTFVAGTPLPRTRGEGLEVRIAEALQYEVVPDIREASSQDLRQAARDIAAVATFCGVAAWSAEDVLDWRSRAGTTRLRAADTRWLLGLPLFVRGDGQFRFAHDLFREWLCAEALQGIGLPKQRQLLQTALPGCDQIAPTLRGMASFLAELDGGFRRWLIEADPLAALMADTGRLPQEQDETLLQAVISTCLAEGRAPWWAANTRGDEPREALRHHQPTDVAAFVLPMLRSGNELERWWGVTCVDAWGAPVEALPILCEMALDASLKGSAREHLAVIVAGSGNADAIRRLYPLLETGDDYVRGPVLEAYRVLEDPSPAVYISKLHGGARNENLLSLLKVHVSRYGQHLDSAQLAEAFAHLADHVGDVGDLVGSLLRGLLERAAELDFTEVPPELVTRLWVTARTDIGSHRYLGRLNALVQDHRNLFAAVLDHALQLFLAGNTDERPLQAAGNLGALAGDHLLELLPLDPNASPEREARFHRWVLNAFWNREPTPERLDHIRTLAPAWAEGLPVPEPCPEPPPREVLADERTVLDAMDLMPDDPCMVAWNALAGLAEVLGDTHRIPDAAAVLEVLDRLGASVRTQAVDALRGCVAATAYERGVDSDGRPTTTNLGCAVVFRVLRQAGETLSAAKLAEYLTCYGFDNWEDTGPAEEHTAMLDELRAADATLWERTVLQLLDGRRLGASRLAGYLAEAGWPGYLPRCQQRLCAGAFEPGELDWLLSYLAHFQPDGYQQTLRECYLLLQRVLPRPDARSEPPTQKGDDPIVARHATQADYWSQFEPLVILMAADDDWAWEEFGRRLAEDDVPVTDSQFVGLREHATLNVSARRCPLLAGWYAAIRRHAGRDGIPGRLWAEAVMGTIRRIGGLVAIAELERLRRESAFPGAEWLSHEIIALRDAMLDTPAPTPIPDDLVASLHDAHHFMLRNDRDLLEVVCEAIEDLARELCSGEGVAGYWDADRPKSEPLCQNILWPALREKLRNWGLADAVERPVGPNPCDWWVELPRRGGEPPLRVAVELKVARESYGHAKLVAPVETQLVTKYMSPPGLRFGVYVVLWFRDARHDYPKAWRTAEALRADVEAECKRVSGDHRVTLAGYVLDLTAPVREH